jgi:putative ATPase
VLKPLDKESLIALLQKAVAGDEALKTMNIKVQEHEALLNISGGDARKL